MTPLTWWVLLATLFGHARIVPARIYRIQNACAILCRAEKLLELNEEEKMYKVGEKGDDEEGKEEKVVVGQEENYDEIHVTSQLVEGRRGLRRRVNDHWLLKDFCLVSYKSRLFCKEFFINLRYRQGCNCQLISSSLRSNQISGRSIVTDNSNKLFDKSQKQEQEQREQQQQEEQRQRQQFRQVEEEKEEERLLLMTMKIMMKMMMKNGKVLSSMEDYYHYLPIKETNNQELVSSAPNQPSTSDEVDWEMWCMAQCDMGHGGSACECDIIP